MSPRVRLLDDRERVDDARREVFDHIAASRGVVAPPFAALLHRPDIARATADLGAAIRFEGSLSDRDRELAISVTAWERACAFEWDIHSKLAREAGVSAEILTAVQEGGDIESGPVADLVAFVRELNRLGEVSATTFRQVESLLGEEGVVELAAVVGYYSMLALFMSACEIA